MGIKSVNPATGEVIARYESAGDHQIDEALASAMEAYHPWRDTSFEHRFELLNQTASSLLKNKDKYAGLMTLEMGKPIKQSIAEIEKCAWVCNYYAQNAGRFLLSREVKTDAFDSHVRYDPLGPILAVMPWNFPFWQVFRFAAPALMAGNVALLKHSSNVPGCALAIEQCFEDAGFPSGVFKTLLIGSGDAKKLIEDKRVCAVTLTGSESAGASVARAAGGQLKKTVLELGGSDPFIVLDDADIDRAAQVGSTARNLNTGQSCIAAKRFIVVSAVAKKFQLKMVELAQRLKMGDPMDEQNDLGPMARDDLRNELHEQVVQTIGSGARLLTGGRIPKGPGYFYPATVLSNVTPSMVAAKEETFGPVAPIIVVKNADEAVAVANQSDLGLGASLWTSDLKKAQKLVARLEAGAVFVNQMVKSDPRLPFGGIKKSGYGRELAQEGIREFVNIKTVWMER